MGRIYGDATKVLICLGPDPSRQVHSKRAADFLRRFNAWFSQKLSELSDREHFPHGQNSKPPAFSDDDKLDSVDALTSHPWFRRGWVMQEAALGRSTWILWGDAEVDWLWLMRAGAWSMTRRIGMAASSTGCRCSQGGTWNAREALEVHVNKYTYKHPEAAKLFNEGMTKSRRNILQTLYDSRRLGFAKQVDQIYAFLGLPRPSKSRKR